MFFFIYVKLKKVNLKLENVMLIVYYQIVTNKNFNKKHHFKDEKYKEKIKKPIKKYKSFIYRK